MMLNKINMKKLTGHGADGESARNDRNDALNNYSRMPYLVLRTINICAVVALAMAAIVATSTFGAGSANAANSKEELVTDSNQSLALLTRTNPKAAEIAKQSKAMLIFPSIVKAGLVFGGAYGEGVLVINNQADSYYNSVTASWGLQIGAQSYGYVVFLMNDKAVNYIRETHGWEIGVGPSVVLVDEGASKNLSTSTLKDDAYAFIFDQQGLMAALNLEGTKITQIKNP